MNSYVVSLCVCVSVYVRELNCSVCQLLWNSPCVCCEYVFLYWLIKKLLWPMAGQNVARWEIQTEIEEERRGSQEDARSCWYNKMY